MKGLDYLRHYYKLIENSKNRKLIGYTEKHHIIPKSLFLDASAVIVNTDTVINVNDVNNLTTLTAKEHFCAHLLLLKIFKNDKNCYERMLYAFNFMRNRIKSSKGYEKQKIAFSKMMSETLSGKPSRAKGSKWSEDLRQKRSGLNHYMHGKTYEEIYGSDKSIQLKRLRSENMKGSYEEKYGDKKAKEMKRNLSERKMTWGDKISKANKGIKLTQVRKDKVKAFMGNDKLNPNVDQTLYEFKNKITGECLYARKYDMKRKYKCNSIHRIIRDTTKSCKGWMFTGNKKEIINE